MIRLNAFNTCSYKRHRLIHRDSETLCTCFVYIFEVAIQNHSDIYYLEMYGCWKVYVAMKYHTFIIFIDKGILIALQRRVCMILT